MLIESEKKGFSTCSCGYGKYERWGRFGIGERGVSEAGVHFAKVVRYAIIRCTSLSDKNVSRQKDEALTQQNVVTVTA